MKVINLFSYEEIVEMKERGRGERREREERGEVRPVRGGGRVRGGRRGPEEGMTGNEEEGMTGSI